MTEGDRKESLRPVVRIPCPPGFTAWLVSAPDVPHDTPGLTADLGGATDLPPAPDSAAPRPYRPSDLAPLVARVADEAIAELPEPPAELHDALARRVAAGVVHELVGGPSLTQQVTRVVAARRTAWGDDLLSDLLLPGRPTCELVIADVALLYAAVEAGARLITGSVHALLRRPAAWHRLRTDPSLAPAAAASTLRHLGVEIGVARRARHDLTIAGHRITTGDFVVTTGRTTHPGAPLSAHSGAGSPAYSGAALPGHSGVAVPFSTHDSAAEASPAPPARAAAIEGLSSVRVRATEHLASVQLATTLERLAVRHPALRSTYMDAPRRR